MIAEILYNDAEGNQKVLLTNWKWMCDWYDAKVQWKNGVFQKTREGISKDSDFIWNQNLNRITTTCWTYLNDSQSGEKIHPGMITLSVDDIVDRITVNNRPINLDWLVQWWNLVNNVTAELKENDFIQITWTNTWGPGWIIAQIKYKNDNWEDQLVLTNGNWICDWWYPSTLGKNGQFIWNRDGISKDSEYIWYTNTWRRTTTCWTYLNATQKGAESNVGKITLSLDDVVEKIWVNDQEVPLEWLVQWWDKTNSVTVPLEEGDKVEIQWRNLWGPGNLIADVLFFDDDDVEQHNYTWAAWTCDGEPATVLWRQWQYSQPRQVDMGAHFIWYKDQWRVVTRCWTTLQKQKPVTNNTNNSNNKTREGKISVSADNEIVQVLVNDTPLPLSWLNTRDWTVTNSIRTALKRGDKITVIAKNHWDFSIWNPGAIMVQIDYEDKNGKRQAVSDWRWKCDWQPCKTFGKNSDLTLWRKVKWRWQDNMVDHAQWIWNQDVGKDFTSASFVLWEEKLPSEVPKGRMKRAGKIFFSVDDRIKSVKVNGEELPLWWVEQNWTKTNQIFVDLQQDDFVEITWENVGGYS